VQVTENGSFEGLNSEAAEAGFALIAKLIGLLETFHWRTSHIALLERIWRHLADVDRGFGAVPIEDLLRISIRPYNSKSPTARVHMIRSLRGICLI
jgi:hypothetical protein